MDILISSKDTKIIYYAYKYRTNELIEKILKTYNDRSIDDSDKKEKIGRYSAAVAVRNIKKLPLQSVETALNHRTFNIVEKIKKIEDDNSFSAEEKRKKINKYCLAIAIRRGAIRIKSSNVKEKQNESV